MQQRKYNLGVENGGELKFTAVNCIFCLLVRSVINRFTDISMFSALLKGSSVTQENLFKF